MNRSSSSSPHMSIHFNSHKALAEFLAAFIPVSTALFTVTDLGDGHYVLTFTGAY